MPEPGRECGVVNKGRKAGFMARKKSLNERRMRMIILADSYTIGSPVRKPM